MSVLKRIFSSRAMRIHLALFVAGALVLVVVDLVQGVNSEAPFVGLDWVHFVILIWVPILMVHVLAAWWGAKADELDKELVRNLRGRGGFFHW